MTFLSENDDFVARNKNCAARENAVKVKQPLEIDNTSNAWVKETKRQI
jgi:hypothetical protein